MAASRKGDKEVSTRSRPKSAAESRAERIARNSPSPRFSGTAFATETPLTAADMSDEEIRAHSAVMSAAARNLVGQTVGGGRNRATILSAADDMSPEAISQRYSRNLGIADDDARAATGDPETAESFYLPFNAMWYHDHHDDMRKISEDTRVPLDRVVATGAVVSPQNDPKKTELPGARRIAEIAGGINADVDISRSAASHAIHVQTRGKARDKARKLNPVQLPVGRQRLDQLSSDQVALMGSVSGAKYSSEDPEKGVTPTQAAAWGAGVPTDESFPAGQTAHPNLSSLRRLGGIRNRAAVSRGLKFARGETTWDKEMRKATGAGVEASRLDQPTKISSYGQAIGGADQFARESEAYNHLVRLYGEGGMQHKLPFDLDSAPRDFWEKEGALDIVYDKPNVGKPGASVWDASMGKSPDVDYADISVDDATHAIINEGGRIANRARPQTLYSDQAINWGVVRETAERGQRAAPELADAASTAAFLAERRRVRGSTPTSSATGYRSQPAVVQPPTSGDGWFQPDLGI
jgi:hypothetical protein